MLDGRRNGYGRQRSDTGVDYQAKGATGMRRIDRIVYVRHLDRRPERKQKHAKDPKEGASETTGAEWRLGPRHFRFDE